eukprot:m.4401 g.4401  ORF g.4401 m.4401 type:complete len:64 (+) comp1936_c0_seq1:121-312(+)
MCLWLVWLFVCSLGACVFVLVFGLFACFHLLHVCWPQQCCPLLVVYSLIPLPVCLLFVLQVSA